MRTLNFRLQMGEEAQVPRTPCAKGLTHAQMCAPHHRGRDAVRGYPARRADTAKSAPKPSSHNTALSCTGPPICRCFSTVNISVLHKLQLVEPKMQNHGYGGLTTSSIQICHYVQGCCPCPPHCLRVTCTFVNRWVQH